MARAKKMGATRAEKALLSLWLLLYVAVARAGLFVPLTCRDSIPANIYCGKCNGQQFITEASLSVTYEANRLNVTVGNRQFVGGFLAYGCNSTYNKTCTLIQKGELYLRDSSIKMNLHPGTECIFFGCYKKGASSTCYQFQAITITATSFSTSSAAATITTSPVVHLAMTSVPEPSSMVVTTVTSSLPSMISNTSLTSGNAPDTRMEAVEKVAVCVLLAFGVMMSLMIVGSAVLAAKLRKKYQNDSFILEWSNDDYYKPVNMSFAPSVSCSMYTIIDSLEKPQLEHLASAVLNSNPSELAGVLKLSDDSLKNDSYLKIGNSSDLKQDTQTIDSPVSRTVNVVSVIE